MSRSDRSEAARLVDAHDPSPAAGQRDATGSHSPVATTDTGGGGGGDDGDKYGGLLRVPGLPAAAVREQRGVLYQLLPAAAAPDGVLLRKLAAQALVGAGAYWRAGREQHGLVVSSKVSSCSETNCKTPVCCAFFSH
eukprot:SAG22_NODE_1679_length_3824_cov_6.607785_2_plen_137_part_00